MTGSLGHPEDERRMFRGSRASGATLSAAVVLVGDELAMPGQDGLGREKAGDFRQELAAERTCLGRPGVGVDHC